VSIEFQFYIVVTLFRYLYCLKNTRLLIVFFKYYACVYIVIMTILYFHNASLLVCVYFLLHRFVTAFMIV